MPSKGKKSRTSPFLRKGALLLLLVLAGAAGTVVPLSLAHVRSVREKGVQEKLRALGELTTVTRMYRSVFYTREKKNFIQDKSILFTAEFSVEAGVNLAEGFDLSFRGTRARLVLPPGRIFLVDADDTSFRQILVKEQFSTIDTGDYLPLIGEEAQSIRSQALDGGICREAEDRAGHLLTAVLRAAGAKEVTVAFREGPFR